MNNLSSDLVLLNKIAKWEVESDWDSESINYIAVDFEKTKELIKEVLENKSYSYDEYIKDYLEDDTIDICGLWGELDQAYQIDTWFNLKKKEFYIVKWYHRAQKYYSDKKRMVKNKVRHIKSNAYFYRYARKEKRELRKRLKQLAKIYRNQNS